MNKSVMKKIKLHFNTKMFNRKLNKNVSKKNKKKN